jgi:hypothetical protein
MWMELRSRLAFGSALVFGFVYSCAVQPEGGEAASLHAEVEAKQEPLVILACSEGEGRIREAVATAEDLVIDALEDLDNVLMGGDTARVDYWFGTHDPTIVGNIHNAYAQILPWLDAATYTCNCADPSPGHIATAVKGNPSAPVELCPSFFDWDFIEYSVGGIIHEAIHWTGIEHTKDGCTTLGSDQWPEEYHEWAKYFPQLAATNAENFRLYALGWHPGQPSTWVCQ